ncbi:GntR family transcriptional regulator [Dactylosporangium sp. NPDC000555]|uniref:GntR family transcriptional regulator n=1 Tax=Dactylosporangium sp. NPDC000555 TaxID=3154260 RepID=UPI0033167BE9
MRLAPVQRTDTVADKVYAQLHHAIVTRALSAGSRLTEAGVAEQLKVSKTPVREALLRLREIGLIEPDGLKGNRVITASPQVLRDAFETRRALEGFAAGVAADRASDAALEAIRRLAEQSLEQAAKGAFDGYLRIDGEFHAAVAEASGNKRIARLIEDAATLMRALRYIDVPPESGVLSTARQHVDIAEALARRDSAAATRHMQAHLDAVEELFGAHELVGKRAG